MVDIDKINNVVKTLLGEEFEVYPVDIMMHAMIYPQHMVLLQRGNERVVVEPSWIDKNHFKFNYVLKYFNLL
jgi:hypothetical protein